MRRILLGLMGAAVGTALMVSYKAVGSPATGPVAATGQQDPAATAGPNGVPRQTGQPAPGTPGSSAAPGMTSGTGTSQTGHPTTSGAAPPSTTTTTTTAPHSRTITGNAVAASTVKSPTCGECSGNMQVRITVTGTHIDSISTIQQSNRPLSTASTLTAQALSAQSANVGNVSGATYSSLAWKQSLQSAINQI